MAGESETTFDYDARSIVIREHSGCCNSSIDTYVMRNPVDDILNPMELKDHSDIHIGPDETDESE